MKQNNCMAFRHVGSWRVFIGMSGFFAIIFLVFGNEVIAAESMTTVMGKIQSTSKSLNANLVAICIKTLGAGLVLQLILSSWKDIFTGELHTMIPKFVGAMMWGAFCVWLINNLDMLSTIFSGYLNLATGISGVTFDPGKIFENGVILQESLMKGFNKATGSDWNPLAAAVNFLPALILALACLLIIVCYGVISLSVLVAIGEFWLMFAVAPIAISLLGLTAFRDQGIAPIKGVISLGLRILVLGVIVKISQEIVADANGQIKAGTISFEYMSGVWLVLGGSFACAAFALMAGKIASAIASGQANFHGTDAIRGGMQMVQTASSVATAGGALAAGGAALAGGAAGAANKAAPGIGAMLGNMMSPNALNVSGGPGGGSAIPGGAFPTKPGSGSAGGEGGGATGSSEHSAAGAGSQNTHNEPGQSNGDGGQRRETSSAGEAMQGQALTPLQAQAQPKSMPPPKTTNNTVPSGSGTDAGVGGASSPPAAGGAAPADLGKAIQDLTRSLTQEKTPTIGDHFKSLGEQGRRIGEIGSNHESGNVGVSINTQARD